MNHFLAVFVLLASIAVVNAWNRQNHFGNPCYLCRCFVHYTDRDVAAPIRPYAMAIDGYDTTEDRCLATCQRDTRCKAAVYGMIGGRSVFTCEFYEKLDTRSSPIYTPYVNMYMKRSTCPMPTSHLSSVDMIPADDSSVKRRAKQEKLMKRKNPFLG